MKHALLALLLIPLFLRAQPSDPRILEMAPAPDVKWVRTTTLFRTYKDSTRLDTAVKEATYFNPNGTPSLNTYLCQLDKSTFTTRTEYWFAPEMWWMRKTYENGRLVDSASISENGWANQCAFGADGRYVVHEYRGDSTQEKVVTGADTILRPKRKIVYHTDEYWDYLYAGDFSRKSIAKSPDNDSIRYYDAEDKCVLLVVNHFDNSFRPVKTEYFNYSIKKFAALIMRYNERLSMIEYVLKSKKGVPSYTVTRKFNEKGLLTEEEYIPAGKKRTHIIRRFDYQYY